MILLQKFLKSWVALEKLSSVCLLIRKWKSLRETSQWYVQYKAESQVCSSHISKWQMPGHPRSLRSSNGNWTKLMKEEPLTAVKYVHPLWASKSLFLKLLEGGKMFGKYSSRLFLFFGYWQLAVIGYRPRWPLAVTSRAILTLASCKVGLWEKQTERIWSIGVQDNHQKGNWPSGLEKWLLWGISRGPLDIQCRRDWSGMKMGRYFPSFHRIITH